MRPILFRIGPLDIHTYGVLVACGFLIGIHLAARRASREGILSDQFNSLGFWLILSGIFGAKLFHMIFFWPEFIAGWRAGGISSLREGFVFYGGFIGACLATIIFSRRRQLPLWKTADACAPSVALGHALGRMGCFFNGCCFGRPSSLPWAVDFPEPHFRHGTPLHPTQIYEAIGNIILFLALSAFYRRKKFDGQIWWMYALVYAALRFGIEFLRGDYETHYLGGLTLGHVVAVGMMIAAGTMLTLLSRGRSAQ